MARSNGIESRTRAVVAWPTLADPQPMKVLLSAILVALALGMVGALGQIVVHDIIPTFFINEDMPARHSSSMNAG